MVHSAPVNFGAWHELTDASRAAPDEPGVLQARAETVRAYPRGKSAMLFYDACDDAESLRGYVTGRGVPGLESAATAGARFVRFGVTRHPQLELARLLGQFLARFGAAPLANGDVDVESDSKGKRTTGDV
jgi:hypothetical protein